MAKSGGNSDFEEWILLVFERLFSVNINFTREKYPENHTHLVNGIEGIIITIN